MLHIKLQLLSIMRAKPTTPLDVRIKFIALVCNTYYPVASIIWLSNVISNKGHPLQGKEIFKSCLFYTHIYAIFWPCLESKKQLVMKIEATLSLTPAIEKREMLYAKSPQWSLGLRWCQLKWSLSCLSLISLARYLSSFYQLYMAQQLCMYLLRKSFEKWTLPFRKV